VSATLSMPIPPSARGSAKQPSPPPVHRSTSTRDVLHQVIKQMWTPEPGELDRYGGQAKLTAPCEAQRLVNSRGFASGDGSGGSRATGRCPEGSGLVEWRCQWVAPQRVATAQQSTAHEEVEKGGSQRADAGLAPMPSGDPVDHSEERLTQNHGVKFS